MIAYLAITLYTLGHALWQQVNDLTGRVPMHRSPATSPAPPAYQANPLEVTPGTFHPLPSNLDVSSVRSLRRLARDYDYQGFTWTGGTPIHQASKAQLMAYLKSLIHSSLFS